MKQIIIAIGREFGSGGHLVAKKLQYSIIQQGTVR